MLSNSALVWLLRGLFVLAAVATVICVGVTIMIVTGHSDGNAASMGFATAAPVVGALMSWFTLRGLSRP